MTEPADPTVWAATSPAAPAPASRATSAAGTATATTPARVTHVTGAGADWLSSASRFPRSVHALWALRPGAPSVLPCGTAFDVVSTPVLYGRRLLDRLWSAGPGSGPAAVHHGRVLVFTAPGCADRLPALLRWEEWRRRGPAERAGHARPDEEPSPPLLCHGLGDTVTIPPLAPDPASPAPATHWLVAPAVRQPWLPGAEMLLWAHLRIERDSRAGRDGEGGGKRIFAPQDRDAKVYDVSRRR